eukprot:559583-Alexandrium_andersonii.AAC.1
MRNTKVQEEVLVRCALLRVLVCHMADQMVRAQDIFVRAPSEPRIKVPRKYDSTLWFQAP